MKRLFDFTIALIALLLLSIPLLVLGLQVRRKLGRPIFFVQERAGLKGRPFDMIKFRTMSEERGSNGHYLDDSKRMTPFGSWLRATSFDEIPELWNVIRGEMSLVGPRPLLMDYLPLYTPEQAKRHDVRPGITGWAQINGRNAISWEQRFALDVWYVNNRNFWLDLKILYLTIWRVLTRQGISAEGEATMPRFTGRSSAKHGEVS